MIWCKSVLLLGCIAILNGTNCTKVRPEVQKEIKNGNSQRVIVECPKSQSPGTTDLIDNLLKQISQNSQNPDVNRRDLLNDLVQPVVNTVVNFLEPVLKLLRDLGITYYILWLSFEISIPIASPELISKLVTIDIVKIIRPDPNIPRIPPQPPGSQPAPQNNQTWNIGLIDARCKDITCFGDGVTVGFIDTGAKISHIEIEENWLGKIAPPFGYLDAVDGNCEPGDIAGKGTAAVATAVGKTVGVAPEALWMMCRACDESGCYESSLKVCALWYICPYECGDTSDEKVTSNCLLRPAVININWSQANDDVSSVPYYFFYDYIQMLNSVNITSIVPSGDNGPGCTTIGFPAGYDNVLDVGSTNQQVTLSVFSSSGPVLSTKPLTKDSIAVGFCSAKNCGSHNKTCTLIKPTIVAPGAFIVSASIKDNNIYATYYGTGLAAAHVTGTVALMICANSKITWTQKILYNILTQTTDTSRIDLLSERQNKNNPTTFQANLRCNIMMSKICNTFPNNLYGYGLLSACKAVVAAKNLKP